MQVHAAFLPQGLQYASDDVCIVIDAVRAGASLVAIAEAGEPNVYLAPSAARARAYRDEFRPRAMLGGEQDGLPPPGFDLGNSPADWRRLDLRGREVVFGTSNGTRAASACSAAAEVFVACFANVSAAAERAAAAGPSAVKIVCAGSHGIIALDDAVCAGRIAARLVAMGGVPADSAVMAMTIARQFEDIPAMLRRSESGRRLINIGLEKDLDDCGRLDSSIQVPALTKNSFRPDKRLLLVA